MTQNITATSVKLQWSPPEQALQHGVIKSYGICFQEASLGTDCRSINSIRGEQLSYSITQGLRPHTKYMFVVMAATKIVGWSPKAVIYSSTLSAG